MSDRLFQLFDEYATAYARGERPSAEEFLNRAGADRQDLAALLDEFVRRAPVHAPTEDDQRFLGFMLADDPPLLRLRVERGMRVDDVVGDLTTRLGVDPTKRAKVKLYYQRLEGGLLDPGGFSKRLRDALTVIFGSAAEGAFSWTAPSTSRAAPAFLRRADSMDSSVPAAPTPASYQEDEVDRLFTGGG